MDQLVTLGTGSQLQHGPSNHRVYLMHVAPEDVELVIDEAERLAGQHGYSKIFGKLPLSLAERFLGCGYAAEAQMRRCASDCDPIVFVSRFLTSDRAADTQAETTAANLMLCRETGLFEAAALPPGYRIEEAGPDALDELATLYRAVFDSYPFPISETSYLAEIMASHVRFFVVRHHDRVVAASSAEHDPAWGIVEMTDFATLPEARGASLANHLLRAMESALDPKRYPLAYTIARALSPAMNITFARAGYSLGGTLVNNTQISGSIQNMNVWYKPLSQNCNTEVLRLQNRNPNQPQENVEILRIDSPELLPDWLTLDDVVDFFHQQMKPYHDTPEDVRRGLSYAFSKRPAEGGFLLIAVDGQRLKGGLTMLQTGMKGYIPENILLFVAVHPDLRGKGIGGRLVQRGLDEADGNVKLHVEHDNPARRLYERSGFTSKYLEMRYTK